MRFPVMTLLNRELRLDARHWKSYAFRVVMLVMIWFCLYAAEKVSRYVGAPGKQFFASLMVINLVLATLAGLSVFAGAITEEKEERTLGLMRMTALNPVTILLGKSTAKMMTVLVLLVAQVPFTLLAVTMGGVSTTQIAAAYLLLGAYVVFVANAALFCSVISKRTAWAIVLMAAILFVTLALPAWIMVARPVRMLLQRGMYGEFSGQPLPTNGFQVFLTKCAEFCSWWTQHGTAMGGMTQIFRSGFDGPIVGPAVLVNLGLGAGFFLVSLLAFDLFTRNETEAGPGRGLLARSRPGWRLFGTGRTWKRSILWKEFYFTNGGWIGMAVKLTLSTLITAGLMAYIKTFGGRIYQREFGEGLMGWSLFLAGLDAVFYAAKMFANERRWNTLSALASLPISARQLWYAKLLAGMPRLLPWLLMFAIGGILAPSSFWRATREIVHDADAIEAMLYAACVIAFFMHLVVWLSLRIRRWSFLVAIVTMIGIGILSSIAEGIGGNELLIALVIGLGVIAVILHILMPREIMRAAASD